ncbi:MAG: hypothetical protein U0793_15075 [Gemmataceae bacterium]
MRQSFASFALLAIAGLGLAKDPLDKESKDVGLTLTLRAKKIAYKLDLKGKTLKEWEEMLTSKKRGLAPPKPPAVDMELEVKNTSKGDIDFWSSGDPVQVQLDLKGPAARTITPPLAFTADFRLPKAMTLKPGDTFRLPLTSLSSGFRGTGTWTYWLQPGEYTLTARYKTGVRPVPPGVKEVYGAGPVTLVSMPITVKVEE